MTKPNQLFLDRLQENARIVENTIQDILQDKALEGEITRPAQLMDAMRHATLNGGKRVRPFLVIETAHLFGVERKNTLMVCTALECLHSYSLVHDDLPAMDDDDLRRGKPTVHIAFDEATAILAGDGLLTLAFDILSRVETHDDAQIRIELVNLLARAAGVGGMVGGQVLDLAAERQTPNEKQIRQLQAMKTGALIRYSCEAGAVLGKAALKDRQTMVKFGQITGQLFQLADDILDVEGHEDKLGKKTAKDEGKNKGTLVSQMGLDKAKEELNRLLDEALLLISAYGERGHILAEAARFIANRDH